jgi:glycerol-3-phosphate dehydrogenase
VNSCSEYACTLVDALARRLRLGFLDTLASLEMADRVADIMNEELGWSPARKGTETIVFLLLFFMLLFFEFFLTEFCQMLN